jgi:hypothetical protein
MVRYRSVLATTLLGVTLVATGACKSKPADDEASIKETLEEKGTIDVMDQVSKAPEYKAPADGKLTDRQVKMYLEVRQREQKIREVAFKELKAKGDKATGEKKEVGMFEAMKAIGDLADVATADLRAAQELGHNPKEYQWVKERVLEAQMLETLRSLRGQVAESQQQILAQLERQRQDTADPLRKVEIGRQIEELKKDLEAAPAESDPAREHNAGLVAQHKDELAKLQAEDERITRELRASHQDDATQSSGDR